MNRVASVVISCPFEEKRKSGLHPNSTPNPGPNLNPKTRSGPANSSCVCRCVDQTKCPHSEFTACPHALVCRSLWNKLSSSSDFTAADL